jgi:hypothetical protein
MVRKSDVDAQYIRNGSVVLPCAQIPQRQSLQDASVPHKPRSYACKDSTNRKFSVFVLRNFGYGAGASY